MVSVITVNYKTRSYLEQMLTSLFAHHTADRLEVFVVENDSGDDLFDLESRFPQVTFLYSTKNRGFAGGCNMALRLATGAFCVLVNPDIRFQSAALHEIEDAMRQHPQVGIGGIRLTHEDGKQQPCVWRFPGVVDQLLVLSKIPHLFHCAATDAWMMKGFDYTKDADVDQVMGAFFCIRRELLQDIGLLDEKFFMWYEEVDYCKRASDRGWKTRYFSKISAIHKGGSSFEKVLTIKKQAMVRKSLRRYMYKHKGWGAWLLFMLCELFFILLALAASILKPY